jgi:hypothetical protein
MATDTREKQHPGTRERHDVATEDHAPVLAPIVLMASMALPAAVGVIGIAVLEFDAIDWLSAIVWGVVATAVFTLFS